MERAARIAFVLATLFTLTMALLPHPPKLPGHPQDKIQHMLAFATLGALGMAGFRKVPLFRQFLGLTLFGVLIEVLQAIPALHRDSDIRDVVADMLAAIAALWLAQVVLDRRDQRATGTSTSLRRRNGGMNGEL